MNNIVLISREQYGYNTDLLKWSKYLLPYFSVTVITLDQGREKVFVTGVNSVYSPYKSSRKLRGILFLLICIIRLLMFKGTIIVQYFPYCEILKRVLFWKKMILDIRTMDVSKNEDERLKANQRIRTVAGKYDFVTVISEGVKDQLGVPNKKTAILPLGADIVTTNKKIYTFQLRLLYVGTLFNRDIDKTIKGLGIALKQVPDLKIHYDIVGSGCLEDEEAIVTAIQKYNLQDIVTMHGYIKHNQIANYLEKCNIGISFVPITDYYQYQPATKTFEYILSGLFTIATETYSNKEVVTPSNGILIKDTPEAFADAIIQIWAMRESLDSKCIQSTLTNYQWENIVRNDLLGAINRSTILYNEDTSNQ